MEMRDFVEEQEKIANGVCPSCDSKLEETSHDENVTNLQCTNCKKKFYIC